VPAGSQVPALRAKWLVAIGLVVALMSVQPVAGSTDETGTFSLVATHPEAAAYPSIGNSLVGLTPWQGKLYTGYGHWVNYTGLLDFAIRAYDPTTNQLVRPWVTRAEAVWNYRPIGDKLYVPLTDPSDIFDYASGEPWENRDPIISARRVFDMTMFNSDLFMVGASGMDAVVWRSVDGGQTWQESLRVPQRNANDLETQFDFSMVMGGKMYVQAFGIGQSGAHPTSKVFDGTTWSTGPNLLPSPVFKGWKPTQFAGKVVYLSGDPENPSDTLLTFNGIQVTQIQTPFRVWDYFVSGSYLYALVLDPSAPLWAPVIRRTSDLVTWTDVVVPPTYTRSIAVLNGYLYVGATEGRLFKYSEPVRRCRQPSRPMSICRRFDG
jgi:hypothetical protein